MRARISVRWRASVSLGNSHVAPITREIRKALAFNQLSGLTPGGFALRPGCALQYQRPRHRTRCPGQQGGGSEE